MCYEVEPVRETVVLLGACVGSSFDNARACACNVRGLSWLLRTGSWNIRLSLECEYAIRLVHYEMAIVFRDVNPSC